MASPRRTTLTARIGSIISTDTGTLHALANKVDNPRTVYPREAAVLPHLDTWIAQLFDEEAIAERSSAVRAATVRRSGNPVGRHGIPPPGLHVLRPPLTRGNSGFGGR